MKARCNKCETVFSGDPDEFNVLVCPNCGAKMRVRPKADADPAPDKEKPKTATGSTAKAAATSKTPSSSPAGAKLPSVMRANKVIAGKTCPACKTAIDFGVQVHNCEKCSTPHHVECWDQKGVCSNASCSGELDLAADKDESSGGDEESGDTTPCKFCGESIKAGARKCRFCGEYQNVRDRQMAAQRTNPTNPSDDEMQAIDWVLCILCGLIGCIVAIVYCIQGKKKGPKMLLVCCVVQGILMIIRVALIASAPSNGY